MSAGNFGLPRNILSAYPSRYSDDRCSVDQLFTRLAAGEDCKHCNEFEEYHASNGQCLFESTSYQAKGIKNT